MPIRPDLTGEDYHVVLQRLHQALRPRTYLEIGSRNGLSLQLSECASIAIDPAFDLRVDVVGAKPECHLYKQTSDTFFGSRNPSQIFGASIDLAFLDGLHLFEYLLRDIGNVERHCRRNSVLVLHDCVPVETGLARRDEAEITPLADHHAGWWTGDVWKVVPILRKHRPDLALHAIDAHPTGLILITGLDPASTELSSAYYGILEEWRKVTLEQYRLDRFFEDLDLISTSSFMSHQQISQFCWL